MPFFMKKPIIVEAKQFTGSNIKGMLEFMGQKVSDPLHHKFSDYEDIVKEKGLHVQTLEGELMAKPGDWIVKGTKGEFWPVRNDIFSASYEPAE